MKLEEIGPSDRLVMILARLALDALNRAELTYESLADRVELEWLIAETKRTWGVDE